MVRQSILFVSLCLVLSTVASVPRNPMENGEKLPVDIPCVVRNETTEIPLFLWTEIPTEAIGTSPRAWRAFYARMLGYVTDNCINARSTRVILRVVHPRFPAALPMWERASISPMYTELISKLPRGVDLQLYPYLGGRSSPASWALESPSGSGPLDGVYNFAIRWNTGLEELNCTARFTGIVLDLEEDFPWDWVTVNETKWRYKEQIPSLGVSIGFDEYAKLKLLSPFVDIFYLQMYDFYTQSVRHITKELATSPFSANRDNPRAIAEWIRDEVLTDPDMFAVYRKYRKRIYIMWSVQAKGSSDCIYPLKGTCGSHYECGLFSPASFNHFMNLVTNDPRLTLFPGVMGHGIFQFNLLRTDWLSTGTVA